LYLDRKFHGLRGVRREGRGNRGLLVWIRAGEVRRKKLKERRMRSIKRKIFC